MIKRTKETLKTERMFLVELEARLAGMKRRVVQIIAQSAAENVHRLAPADHAQLGNYTKNIEVAQVKDEPVYVTSVQQRASEQMVPKPALSLLYIKDIEKPRSRSERIYKALQEYEPFTVKTWPTVIPRDERYVFTRLVSEREVKTIAERNLRQFEDMQKTLGTFSVRIRKSQLGIKELAQVDHDFAFTVIKTEKGIGVVPKPHWRPGTHAAKMMETLNKIKNDPGIKASLTNPDYAGYADLGNIQKKTNETKAKQTESFRKIVLGD